MAARCPSPALRRRALPKKPSPATRPRKPRLPKKVRLALDDFQRRLLDLFPNDIRQIILYGSYARGDWRQESDVDVMVIVSWPHQILPGGYFVSHSGDPRWNAIIDAGVDAMFEHGPVIAPMVIGESVLAKLPVVTQAQREGVVLWKKQPAT